MAKRPPKAPTAPEPDTRERILAAAADAWHQNSFDGVGTAELCRLAKVHKGSFFHFFASKDDLLLAVLDRHAQRIRVGLRAGPFRAELPPLARFTQFFAYMGDTARAQVRQTGCVRGCPIGNIVIELATRSPAVQQAAARVFDEMQAVFVEAIEQAIAEGSLPPDTDAATTATTVLAFMQGLAVVGKAYGSAARMQRLAASVDVLLRDPPRRAVRAARRARAARR